MTEERILLQEFGVVMQVPDVSVMLQTSDFPCMRVNKSVPDMQFRNFDIPVRGFCLDGCSRHELQADCGCVLRVLLCDARQQCNPQSAGAAFAWHAADLLPRCTTPAQCWRLPRKTPMSCQLVPINAKVPEEHYNGRPIPVMGYNRKEGFLDLMFPDFTYFGNEYSQITGWHMPTIQEVSVHRS